MVKLRPSAKTSVRKTETRRKLRHRSQGTSERSITSPSTLPLQRRLLSFPIHTDHKVDHCLNTATILSRSCIKTCYHTTLPFPLPNTPYGRPTNTPNKTRQPLIYLRNNSSSTTTDRCDEKSQVRKSKVIQCSAVFSPHFHDAPQKIPPTSLDWPEKEEKGKP